MAGVSSGQILRLKEVSQLGSDLEGKSVRTWGRVLSHDLESCQVKITDEGHEFCIGSALVEPMAFSKGSIYQFIGEMKALGNTLILQARIATCIDGMDTELFAQALDMRRTYLQEMVHRQPLPFPS